jgi:iron(III) transport system permease protein
VPQSSAELAAGVPDRTVRDRLSGEDLLRYGLVAAVAAVLGLFLLYPLTKVVWRSFLGSEGQFVGLANYARYFQTPAVAASVTNSVLVSLLSMVLTVALAFAYAYALARTRMPGKELFRMVALLPLFAPSLVQVIAVIYAFGNNGIVTRLAGVNVGIYGAKGIVLAEVLSCFPHALLNLLAALAVTDARLYDAARAMGASPGRIFLTVTLPGVKYGLMSACFVVFTLVITDFGAPKVVGGKFPVMATEIYNQVSGQQNFTMGATVSVVLLVPGAGRLRPRPAGAASAVRRGVLGSAPARPAAPPHRGQRTRRLLRPGGRGDPRDLPGDPRVVPRRAVAVRLHADLPSLRL